MCRQCNGWPGRPPFAPLNAQRRHFLDLLASVHPPPIVLQIQNLDKGHLHTITWMRQLAETTLLETVTILSLSEQRYTFPFSRLTGGDDTQEPQGYTRGETWRFWAQT